MNSLVFSFYNEIFNNLEFLLIGKNARERKRGINKRDAQSTEKTFLRLSLYIIHRSIYISISKYINYISSLIGLNDDNNNNNNNDDDDSCIRESLSFV